MVKRKYVSKVSDNCLSLVMLKLTIQVSLVFVLTPALTPIWRHQVTRLLVLTRSSKQNSQEINFQCKLIIDVDQSLLMHINKKVNLK